MTFHEPFLARGRSREIPEEADVYGWLIGSWDLDVAYFVTDPVTRMKGEVHFAWVLDGRAVQDVWIMPPVSDRTPGAVIPIDTFGTTLRIWDPSIQAWRVTWFNPPSGHRDELIGRRNGNEIVQIGTHSDGTPIRWKFSEITPNSFRWTGDALQSDGTTWKLEAEFHAKRKESLMQDLREHLLALLTGESAHANFESAIRDVPGDVRGKKPKGVEHSLWETLEHLRITQWDILEYVRNPKHVSPEFPSGYWPAQAAPPSDDAWEKSIAAFRRDLRDIADLVRNKATDLLAPMPHAGVHTILREILLAADHNAYHIGQFIFLRNLLGAWSTTYGTAATTCRSFAAVRAMKRS